MNDPHVVFLTYRIKPCSDLKFDNPPAVQHDNDVFKMTLADGMVTFEMKEHFPSIEAARKPADRFLKSWEIQTGLQYNKSMIRFVYEDAQVIDRRPSPAEGKFAYVCEAAGATASAGSAAVTVRSLFYPEPPRNFATNPDIETLWNRYKGFLDGKEPLQSMGYFCVTALESLAAGSGVSAKNHVRRRRRKAAEKYKISIDVLNKLGELTSEKGNPATARKYAATVNALTSSEAEFIEAAVKVIIKRLGKDPDSAAEITLADLPNV
jgi:hypothetical protein